MGKRVRDRLSSFVNKTRIVFTAKDEMSISRKNIVFSGYALQTVNSMVGGNFLTGFLLLLQADDAFIGLIAVITYSGNLLQILSPLILERYESRKKILITARGAIYMLNIVIIGVVPFFPFADKTKLLMIITVILALNLVNAIFSPGNMVWFIGSIPERIRAGFFSYVNITNSIVLYLFVFVASRTLDYCKAMGNEALGFNILRVAALLLAVADITFLFKIKEYPNQKPDIHVNLASILIAPFKERKYLVTVFIACLYSFTIIIYGPYFSIYLLKDLHVSYSFLNLIDMLNIPLIIIFTPLWVKVIQRTSWFKSLYIAICLISTTFIGYAFVTERNVYLYGVLSIFWFMVVPGINLPLANLPYINIPNRNQTNFIGFYGAMNNLAALMGVTLGKVFIKHTEGLRLTLFGTSMQNKQYIMMLNGFMLLFAGIIICLLQKKVVANDSSIPN